MMNTVSVTACPPFLGALLSTSILSVNLMTAVASKLSSSWISTLFMNSIRTLLLIP